MTIISTTVGKNPFRKNGVAIIVNKRVQNSVLGCNLKNDRMISVPFKTSHSISKKMKSMPQSLMLKNLKLNGSMKTF